MLAYAVWLSRLLPGGVLAFGIAAFALPGEAAYAFVFYVCVIPAVALNWREIRLSSRGDWLALALIAWSGLTLLWGEGPPKRVFQFALGAAATACFFVALRRLLADAEMRRRLAVFLVCAGAASAGLVLLFRAPSLLAGERILGWGITRQPILGASVIAVCCLTALASALGNRGASPLPLKKTSPHDDGGEEFLPAILGSSTRLGRGFCAAAALLMAVFILAMQSRGALLGAAGGAMLILACGPWRWRAAASLATLAAGWLVLAPASLRAHAVRLLLDRGTSHRLEIWARTVKMIGQKPFFGHGLAANVPLSPTGFPHSLYLSLLFYSGILGLLIFLGLAFVVTERLARRPMSSEQAWVAALCLNGVLAGITDLGQITKGPGPLWFIIWLPVALALCLRPPAADQATRSKAGPSTANHSVAARR